MSSHEEDLRLLETVGPINARLRDLDQQVLVLEAARDAGPESHELEKINASLARLYRQRQKLNLYIAGTLAGGGYLPSSRSIN